MNYILFDDTARNTLLPFTHTRPIADIRCGILTMRERWEHLLEQTTGTLTEHYLQEVYPSHIAAEGNLVINGAVFATAELVKAIKMLPAGSKLVKDQTVIAAFTGQDSLTYDQLPSLFEGLTEVFYPGTADRIQNVWDIFSRNEAAIKADFSIITKDRISAGIPEGVIARNREHIFIEPSATVNPGTVLNAVNGPIYIGKNAEVMEGCLIRGSLSLGDQAVLKMGAKVYGGTTIGPGCKVGGEVSNAVFFANSNKGHDGFLGNAVIGEWCNLGADTNCSNLKNNYDEVKIWDEYLHKSVKTGLTFCGLIMGDHSKCGINTMFNTGTVAGVSCNIYGGSFPEKFIPSFAWGSSEELVVYDFKRAMDTARRMMARRNRALSDAEESMYRSVFERTQKQRDFIFGLAQ